MKSYYWLWQCLCIRKFIYLGGNMKRLLLVFVVFCGVMIIGGTCIAKDDTIEKKSTGQTVYLGLGKFFANNNSVTQFFNTRIILRNLDIYNSITITSVEIFGPDGVGDFIVDLADEPIVLAPLASTTLGLDSRVPFLEDGSGGRQSALITWESILPVNPPDFVTAIASNLVTPDGIILNSLTQAQGQVIE